MISPEEIDAIVYGKPLSPTPPTPPTPPGIWGGYVKPALHGLTGLVSLPSRGLTDILAGIKGKADTGEWDTYLRAPEGGNVLSDIFGTEKAVAPITPTDPMGLVISGARQLGGVAGGLADSGDPLQYITTEDGGGIMGSSPEERKRFADADALSRALSYGEVGAEKAVELGLPLAAAFAAGGGIPLSMAGRAGALSRGLGEAGPLTRVASMAVDPTLGLMTGLHAGARAGKAALGMAPEAQAAAARAMGAGFVPGMALGGAEELSRAKEMIGQEGMSPEALGAALGGVSSLGFAGLGALHALAPGRVPPRIRPEEARAAEAQAVAEAEFPEWKIVPEEPPTEGWVIDKAPRPEKSLPPEPEVTDWEIPGLPPKEGWEIATPRPKPEYDWMIPEEPQAGLVIDKSRRPAPPAPSQEPDVTDWVIPDAPPKEGWEIATPQSKPKHDWEVVPEAPVPLVIDKGKRRAAAPLVGPEPEVSDWVVEGAPPASGWEIATPAPAAPVTPEMTPKELIRIRRAAKKAEAAAKAVAKAQAALDKLQGKAPKAPPAGPSGPGAPPEPPPSGPETPPGPPPPPPMPPPEPGESPSGLSIKLEPAPGVTFKPVPEEAVPVLQKRGQMTGRKSKGRRLVDQDGTVWTADGGNTLTSDKGEVVDLGTDLKRAYEIIDNGRIVEAPTEGSAVATAETPVSGPVEPPTEGAAVAAAEGPKPPYVAPPDPYKLTPAGKLKQDLIYNLRAGESGPKTKAAKAGFASLTPEESARVERALFKRRFGYDRPDPTRQQLSMAEFYNMKGYMAPSQARDTSPGGIWHEKIPLDSDAKPAPEIVFDEWNQYKLKLNPFDAEFGPITEGSDRRVVSGSRKAGAVDAINQHLVGMEQADYTNAELAAMPELPPLKPEVLDAAIRSVAETFRREKDLGPYGLRAEDFGYFTEKDGKSVLTASDRAALADSILSGSGPDYDRVRSVVEGILEEDLAARHRRIREDQGASQTPVDEEALLAEREPPQDREPTLDEYGIEPEVPEQPETPVKLTEPTAVAKAEGETPPAASEPAIGAPAESLLDRMRKAKRSEPETVAEVEGETAFAPALDLSAKGGPVSAELAAIFGGKGTEDPLAKLKAIAAELKNRPLVDLFGKAAPTPEPPKPIAEVDGKQFVRDEKGVLWFGEAANWRKATDEEARTFGTGESKGAPEPEVGEAGAVARAEGPKKPKPPAAIAFPGSGLRTTVEQRVAEQSAPMKGSAWAKMLDKIGPTQVEYSGLKDWLLENKDASLAPKDVMSQLKKTATKVKVVERKPQLLDDGPTQWTEGTRNHRELLFKIPGVEVVDKHGEYPPDVPMWLRISDRPEKAGEKTLVIEEVQRKATKEKYPFSREWEQTLLRYAVDYARKNGYNRIEIAGSKEQIKRWGEANVGWEKTEDGVRVSEPGKEKFYEPKTLKSEAELAKWLKDNYYEYSPSALWERMQAEESGQTNPRGDAFRKLYDETLPKELEKIVKETGSDMEVVRPAEGGATADLGGLTEEPMSVRYSIEKAAADVAGELGDSVPKTEIERAIQRASQALSQEHAEGWLNEAKKSFGGIIDDVKTLPGGGYVLSLKGRKGVPGARLILYPNARIEVVKGSEGSVYSQTGGEKGTPGAAFTKVEANKELGDYLIRLAAGLPVDNPRLMHEMGHLLLSHMGISEGTVLRRFSRPYEAQAREIWDRNVRESRAEAKKKGEAYSGPKEWDRGATPEQRAKALEEQFVEDWARGRDKWNPQAKDILGRMKSFFQKIVDFFYPTHASLAREMNKSLRDGLYKPGALRSFADSVTERAWGGEKLAENKPSYSIISPDKPKREPGPHPLVDRDVDAYWKMAADIRDEITDPAARLEFEKKLKLARQTPERWDEAFDKEVKKALRSKTEEQWLRTMERRALTSHEVNAVLDGIKGRQAEVEALSSELEEAKASGDVAKASKVQADLLTKQMSKSALVAASRNNLTGIARALAAAAKFRDLGIIPDRELKTLFKELPGISDAKAQALADMAKDPKRSGEMAEALQDAMNPSVLDKILEFWKAGLVSALPTQGANTGSTAMEQGFRVFETALSAGIRKALGQGGDIGGEAGAELKGMAEAGLTKGVRKRVRGSLGLDEEVAQARGQQEAVSTAAERLIGRLGDAFFMRPEKIDLTSGVPLEYQTGAIKGKKGRLVRMPFRFLDATDKYFQEVAGKGELYKMAYRKAMEEVKAGKANDADARWKEILLSLEKGEGTYQDLRVKSMEMARERVYRGEPDKGLRAVNNLRTALGPIGHIILPFTSTPWNVAKMAWRRSPLASYGIGKRVIDEYIAAKDAGRPMNLTPELADDIAKMTLGSIVAGTVFGMAQSGLLVGSGPVDTKKRNLLRDTGWTPYSFKIPYGDGFVYVPFSRFEPISSVMGIAADWGEINMTDDADISNKMDKLLGSVAQNITSKTYLRGLSDAASMISKPMQFAGQYFRNIAGSTVPNIVRKTAQVVDPAIRELRPTSPGLGGYAQSVGRAVASGIPSLSKTVPERRTATGRPAGRESTGIGFFSPVAPTASKPDREVEKLLLEADYVPSEPKRTKSVKGVQVPLEEEEYQSLLDSRLKATEYIAKNFIGNPKFDALPPTGGRGTKAYWLEKVYNDALNDAWDRIMAKNAKSLRERYRIKKDEALSKAVVNAQLAR